MARMSLHAPTLSTSRLSLRPFTDADVDALFTLHSSAHVLRYWDAPPWEERARAERFIAACRQMEDEGTGARLAVDRLSDGDFLGWCSLTGWNPDYRSASLGYVFDAAAWGHGYATETARALLEWAFDTLDLNRVQAETDTRNGASARVLGKLGFLHEGTLREDCIVNGDVSDSWVFGLLRREWRPGIGARALTRPRQIGVGPSGHQLWVCDAARRLVRLAAATSGGCRVGLRRRTTTSLRRTAVRLPLLASRGGLVEAGARIGRGAVMNRLGRRLTRFACALVVVVATVAV